MSIAIGTSISLGTSVRYGSLDSVGGNVITAIPIVTGGATPGQAMTFEDGTSATFEDTTAINFES